MTKKKNSKELKPKKVYLEEGDIAYGIGVYLVYDRSQPTGWRVYSIDSDITFDGLIVVDENDGRKYTETE